MNLDGAAALVTGGASGLGLATARRLLDGGAAAVTIVDLPTSDGVAVAKELGPRAKFSAADVSDAEQMAAAVSAAAEAAPLRVLVHCAGRGGALRLVGRDGAPGSLELFETVIRVNLVGTFNVLRLAAAEMASLEPVDGERGVCVLTASIAAYEGQIGQVPYASAKGGIVGMTIVAARDLAGKAIRVCTIAPGIFDTPILARVPEATKAALGESVPHPRRLGQAPEFAELAAHIVSNPMLNGEVIRLDGALRMPPR